MGAKLLTEHHLEFLSLKGGCTGSSESTLVKMPHCWKSHVAAQMCFINLLSRKKDTIDFFVGPDLGPNCLKRLSADDTSR